MAKRGRHELSYWRQPPPDGPLQLGVIAWKPLTPSTSPHEAAHYLYGDPNDDGSFVRPPEPVYPLGDIYVRITPAPRRLLHAMRDGVRLHERAWRWTEWYLIAPGQPPRKIDERGINALRRVAFIERDGILPPRRLGAWRNGRNSTGQSQKSAARGLPRNQTLQPCNKSELSVTFPR